VVKRLVFPALVDVPGQPQWAPDQRAVTWSMDTDRGAEIFQSNLANRVRALSRGRSPSDVAPAWSPDGRRIAFVSLDNHLTTMAPDGSHRRTILRRGPARVLDPGPVWAPDGRTIAFAYRLGSDDTPGRAKYSIHVVHPNGSGVRRVTVTPRVDILRSIAWSPTSDRIAWSDTRGVMSVTVRNGRAQRLTHLNGDAEYVAWAPSGKLLFTVGGHLWTLLPGARARRVF